ncbi:MAG: hypothetical protein KKA67_13085 [Spirochaetes bacterium]|nr:hypothetical protein [Spirochaetota bacterium]MBU1081680.1 hypothetical protein [Spirochaetota bacterium]
MYAFFILSMPLSFLVASAWALRSSEAVSRAFARGALFGIPAVLLWLLAAPAYSPVYGSPLLVVGFFLRYWLLPFGLTTAAYAAAVGFSRLARGDDYERCVAFVAGSLTMFGIAHSISSWGDRSAVFTLAVPSMLAASASAFPALLEEAAKDGMPGALKQAAIALAGFAIAALAVSLFFMRLEWLGAVMTALFTAGAAFLGWKRLVRPERPARPAAPV